MYKLQSVHSKKGFKSPYATRKREKVTIKGVFRSLKAVAYHAIGIEANNVGST